MKRAEALEDKSTKLYELTFTSSLSLHRSEVCKEFIDLCLTDVGILGDVNFYNAYISASICLTRYVDIVIDPSHAFNRRLCDPPGPTSVNKACLVLRENTPWWFLIEVYKVAGGTSKLLDLLYIRHELHCTLICQGQHSCLCTIRVSPRSVDKSRWR